MNTVDQIVEQSRKLSPAAQRVVRHAVIEIADQMQRAAMEKLQSLSEAEIEQMAKDCGLSVEETKSTIVSLKSAPLD